MAPKPDEPLRKVTLNLYEADCARLESSLGRGWSEQVRQWVRQHTNALAKPKLTVGDLFDDQQ